MSRDKRKREKPVSTGSIAFRIGLRSGFNLLLLFIVLDMVLFCVMVLPGIAETTGHMEITIENPEALRMLLKEWKVDVLLRAEGLLVVL